MKNNETTNLITGLKEEILEIEKKTLTQCENVSSLVKEYFSHLQIVFDNQIILNELKDSKLEYLKKTAEANFVNSVAACNESCSNLTKQAAILQGLLKVSDLKSSYKEPTFSIKREDDSIVLTKV